MDEKGLVELIEFEIERVAKEREGKGYKPWLVYSALVVIGWQALSIFYSGAFDAIATAAAFVCLILMNQLLLMIRPIFYIQSGLLAGSRKYKLAHETVCDSRLETLAQFGAAAIALVFAFSLLGRLGEPLAIFTISDLILICVAHLAIISLSYVDVPISESVASSRLQISVQLMIGLVRASIIGALVWQIGSLPRAESTLNGLKLGMSLWAVAKLFTILGRWVGASWLFSKRLVALRRQIALELVSFKDAKREAEIIVLGMDFATLLQEPLDRLLKYTQMVRSKYRTVVKLLDDFNSLPLWSEGKEVVSLPIMNERLNIIQTEANDTRRYWEAARTEYKRFKMRAKFSYSAQSRDKDIFNSLLDLLELELDEVSTEINHVDAPLRKAIDLIQARQE